MPEFAFEAIAEDALLLRFGGAIDPAINARVQAAAHALRHAGLPGITDIAPAYASLLARFDPSAWPVQPALRAAIAAALQGATGAAAGAWHQPRTIEIPVCYGAEYGPDLAAVATQVHLSEAEVIARHAAGAYTVAMLGFAPGFPYLLGLDATLHVPRRSEPRTRVPAGSVAIGGAQTGIYPKQLPGGWHLLGRTPLRLFDAAREPPTLLVPGDGVRFRPIAHEEFVALAAASA